MEIAAKSFNQHSIYSSRVEYIEGTRSVTSPAQWIDTLVPVSSKIRLELVAEVTQAYSSRSERYCLIGDNNYGSRSQGISFVDGVTIAFIDYNWTTTAIKCHYVNKKNTYVYDSIRMKCSVSEIETDLLGGSAAGKTYGILHYPNNPSSWYVAAKIYSCKISNESGLLFDAFPVRVRDEGCLYDKVSGKLFKNAGAGKFVLGPDVEGDE